MLDALAVGWVVVAVFVYQTEPAFTSMLLFLAALTLQVQGASTDRPKGSKK